MNAGLRGNKKTVVFIGLIIISLVVLAGIWKISDLQYLMRPSDQSREPVSKKIAVADLSRRTAPVVIRKKIFAPAERIAQKQEPTAPVDIRTETPSDHKTETHVQAPEIQDAKQADKPEPITREDSVAPKETIEKPEAQKALASKTAVTKEKAVITPEVKKQPVPVITTTQEDAVSVTKAVPHPYTIMLASCKLRKSADAVVSKHRKLGLSPYIVKVDLGDKGEWLRILAGHYENKEEALKVKNKNNLTDSKVVKMPYANLIDTYSSKSEAAGMVQNLEELGYSPYFTDSPGGTHRLFVGAFFTREGAQRQKTELHSKGILNQNASKKTTRD